MHRLISARFVQEIVLVSTGTIIRTQVNFGLAASRRACGIVLTALVCLISPCRIFAHDLAIQYLGNFGIPAQDLAISDHIAYVAAAGEGLLLLDITDPAKPREIGAWTNAAALRVAVSGRYAYVSDWNNHLQIIDISIPENPKRVGGINDISAFGVSVAGQYAVVMTRTNGFQVFDIAEPANPQRLGGFATSPDARVKLVGTIAYVADRRSGLQVIDVQDPVTPRLIANYTTAGSAVDVAAHGHYVYLSEEPEWDDQKGVVGNGGLHVIDVSDPANPRRVSDYTSSEFIYVGDVAVVGTSVCIFAAGFKIVDVSSPAQPKLVGHFDAPNDDTFRMAFSGDSVYVPDPPFMGMHGYKIQGPANPQRIGSYEEIYVRNTGQQVTGVAGEYACLVKAEYHDAAGTRIPSSLQIIDIRNPSQPIRVNGSDLSELDIRNSPTDLAMTGHYAYVTGYALGGEGKTPGGGLQVIDLSDPLTPRLVSTWERGRDTAAVALAGRYAYVGGWGGLHVLDVSNPAVPREIGAYKTANLIQSIAVQDDFAYVAHWDAGLYVVDVSDPANPRRAGGYREGYAHGVTLSGQRAYLSESQRGIGTNAVGGGLIILDISDPAAPKRVGVYAEGAQLLSRVAVAGPYTYATFGSGLQVIDVSDAAHPAAVGKNSVVSGRFIVAGKRLFAAPQSGHGLAILDLFRPFRLHLEVNARSGVSRVFPDGPRGASVQLQHSSNLIHWIDWQSATLTEPPAGLTDQSAGIDGRRFYRAIMQ